MFSRLILECRAALTEGKRRSKRYRRNNATLDERPEINLVPGPTFAKRGIDGTAPYSSANAGRSTIGGGSGQSSHT